MSRKPTKAKTIAELEAVKSAIDDLINGLNGKPFRWGSSEYNSKEYLLARNGYALVSKSKLERGGHELKAKAMPVGSAYFGSPIRKYADLYLLGLQTERTTKWYDKHGTGGALLEGDYQFRRQEYDQPRKPKTSQLSQHEIWRRALDELSTLDHECQISDVDAFLSSKPEFKRAVGWLLDDKVLDSFASQLCAAINAKRSEGGSK